MEQPSKEILAEEFIKIRTSLVYHAWQITKNEQDAEEVVDGVIEHFLELINRGELRMYNANYKTYLHTAVKHRSFNLIRDRKRRTKILDIHDVSEASETNQEDILNLKELKHLYLQSLEFLPEHQRNVLKLRIIDDCSYIEMAEKEGVKLGTIMSRLSRARTAIHEVLSANSDFEDLLDFKIH